MNQKRFRVWADERDIFMDLFKIESWILHKMKRSMLVGMVDRIGEGTWLFK
ncbi:hypothetical protein MTR_3g101950 [Medicago truncatula]|uniref:Uncharacterized protein n=1 Tax=Medicago truncatula TaxID=3880 RepID=G7J6X3_MEDTR|nr:hypothetical protein MTR_3g101950 [Medicago truncatula]